QQTHLTSNKIPRQPKKIWKQVLLRKTKEKLYPKVLDNYRGSRDFEFYFGDGLMNKTQKDP
ncbi:MAG TPA: hypothetical protein H9990_07675, partial [Candidatus Parasutterella gallistercoris]|nr:hypothetical protein [Candidatus Parasutterella gallistercoris]